MTQNLRYRALLRSVFAAVMQAGLSASDLRLLAKELRGGRLPDELADMLDEVSRHFKDSPVSPDVSGQVKSAERLMKEKKVSKPALFSILRSIDATLVPKQAATANGILREFFTSATSEKAEKLFQVLNAAGDTDPYLRGIVETRR